MSAFSKVVVLFVTFSGGLWSLGVGRLHADWPQFRGPASAGISSARDVPVSWGDGDSVVWRTELRGAGASSPIAVGDRVFVTGYSGYGLDAEKPGVQSALELHLSCYDLESGKLRWSRSVEPAVPDESYEGWLPEHGYASATPASDGEAVFAFFGKSGVHAFDLDGKPLWRADVGSGTHRFGTAGSPLVHDGLVIINACVESDAIIAFDKKDGREVWRSRGIQRAWSTPVLVATADGKKEVVVSTEGAVLAFDPKSGERLWSCEGIDDYVCPSVVSHDGVVYAFGGRNEVKSLAVRSGGRGDVTSTRRLWKSREGSKVPSPVYHAGRLYWISHTGIAHCMDAKTGALVYKTRLDGLGPRNKTYASPLLVDDRIYYVTCEGGAFVVEASPEFRQLAHNVLDDESIFNASPAVAGERIILRSDRYLYAIGKAGEES